MISSTNQPKSKTELVRFINKLPPNVKFEVVEVFSMKDKPTINKFYDRDMRKGHFSVMFIEGGD